MRPKLCPSCGSKYLLGFKAGTEQIEEAVYKEFPGARVLRMDADSTKSKESYEKILSAFADGKADIHDMAAGTAGNEARIPSAIKKEHSLLSCRQPLLHQAF